MFKKPLFKGSRIRLTGNRSGDVEVMAAWQEDDVYQRLVDTDFARPAAMAREEENHQDSSHISFRIRTIDDDRLIGFVALFNIEWNNRCAVMAIGIGDEKDRGQGYGAEALQLVLNYAFNELNLHRVSLDVISYNEPAIRAYLKAGFKEEGRRRQSVHREGTYYDRIDMGILQPEWINQ